MSYAQTDWRALCGELISLVERCPVTSDADWIAERNELIVQVHGARRTLLAQPEPEVAGPTRLRTERRTGPFGEWTALIPCNSPAPAPAGEVAEFADALRDRAAQLRAAGFSVTAGEIARAADLLERQSAPAPSDVYFEFVVSDADCCTQAGGIAPTYAQALSEGQHYLFQYQQGGPHTLEVRRVEVLHPDALPVLPEDAQVIEPTEHTILVPAPVPVEVSERPWEREGWCDEQGRCWWFDSEDPVWVFDDATTCRHWSDFSLPHNALPLPSGGGAAMSKLPLWEALRTAYFRSGAPTPAVRYANQIIALRDWLVPEEPEAPVGEGEPWPQAYQQRSDAMWEQRQVFRAQLTAEADRAEQGDVKP